MSAVLRRSIIRGMKEKVIITVKGNEASYTVPGVWECRGGETTLRYAEPACSGMGRVETALTLSEGLAVLRRGGVVRSEFRFAEGVPHQSVYATTLGSFPAVVETRALRVKQSERSILLELRYRLTIGGAADEHRLKLLARREETI